MIQSLPKCRFGHASILLLAMATIAEADDLRNWYCPYTTDGACAPKRQTYGYFAPKWRRWPGVTNSDYESKRPPQEPAAPPQATEDQGLPPTELLLPPTNFPRDAAPVPPGGAGEPQPLTPEAPTTPDILSPPGEDVMDELLPGLEQPSAPRQRPPAAQQPSTPRPTVPSGDATIPFPEAEGPAPAAESNSPAEPAPLPPDASSPKAKESPPTTPPGESDPFKDDPFFNDAAPVPGESRPPHRLDRQLELPSQPVPAAHEVPARLPAADSGRLPQSRLSRTSGSARPIPVKLRRDVSQSGPRANPLRAAPPLADRQVLPAAAWQAETDLATPMEVHHNSLR